MITDEITDVRDLRYLLYLMNDCPRQYETRLFRAICDYIRMYHMSSKKSNNKQKEHTGQNDTITWLNTALTSEDKQFIDSELLHDPSVWFRISTLALTECDSISSKVAPDGSYRCTAFLGVSYAGSKRRVGVSVSARRYERAIAAVLWFVYRVSTGDLEIENLFDEREADW